MRLLFWIFLPLFFSGCAVHTPALVLPASSSEQFTLPATTPSDSTRTQHLLSWWEQFESPALLALQTAAQEQSSSLAQARLQLQSAQNALTLAQDVPDPKVLSQAGISRSTTLLSPLASNSATAGIQLSWEIDLFNKAAIQTNIKQLELENAKAAWHDARTLVAARTASAYFHYHLCHQSSALVEQQLHILQKHIALRSELVAQGLEPLSTVQLLRLKEQNLQNTLSTTKQQCTLERRALQAITALPPSQLEPLLAQTPPANPSLFVPLTIPAALFAQRPDVLAAKNALQSALFNKTRTRLATYPSVSLNGAWSMGALRTPTTSLEGSFWSVGPLSISLPLLDPKVIDSALLLADAQIAYQSTLLKSTLEQATKEVDSALLSLAFNSERLETNSASIHTQQQLLLTAQQSYAQGLTSGIEPLEAQSALLSLHMQQLTLQKDRIVHWIDLYKAIGGGFSREHI